MPSVPSTFLPYRLFLKLRDRDPHHPLVRRHNAAFQVRADFLSQLPPRETVTQFKAPPLLQKLIADANAELLLQNKDAVTLSPLLVWGVVYRQH